jgi:hypothetical protein
MARRALAALTALLVVGACSSDDEPAPPPAAAASPITTVAVTTTPALTAPPSPTLPLPLEGTVAVTVPSQPGVTVTALTGGDPERFCANLELSFPASFVISLGGTDDPAGAGVAEVAMAPVLLDTLEALAASAPRELVSPFVLWDDRNRQALAAFGRVGAPADATLRFAADLRAELQRMQDGTSEGAVFDDLPAAAARYGIDAAALRREGRAFFESYGTFDEFFESFSIDLTLAPRVQQELEQRFPCTRDLATTEG